MAIWSTEASSGELTIKIQGRFDFSAHQEFRDAYEKVSEDPKGYCGHERDHVSRQFSTGYVAVVERSCRGRQLQY